MNTPRHPPSQRALRRARRNGDVFASSVLTSTTGWVVAMALSVVYGLDAWREVQRCTAHLWGLIGAPPTADALYREVAHACSGVAWVAALWVVAVGSAMWVARLSQVRPMFSVGLGLPKTSRLRRSVVQTGVWGRLGVQMGLVAGLCVCLCLAVARCWEVWSTHGAAPRLVWHHVRALCVQWAVVGVVFAGLDAWVVYRARMKRLRMTDRERDQEQASQRVDPEVDRARRRAMRGDSVLRGGLDDVPKATLVVYNAAHTIALLYKQGHIPTILASGTGPLGVAIKTRASLHGVPMFRVEELVRVLSGVPLGAPCPDALLPEVARWVVLAAEERQKAA